VQMTLLRFSDMGGRDKVCRHVSIPSTISLPWHRSTAAAAVAAHSSVPAHTRAVSSPCAAGGSEEAPATDVCMVDVGDGQDGGGLSGADERGGGASLQGDASAAGMLCVP